MEFIVSLIQIKKGILAEIENIFSIMIYRFVFRLQQLSFRLRFLLYGDVWFDPYKILVRNRSYLLSLKSYGFIS